MNDILDKIFNETGFYPEKIKKINVGSKYTAVMTIDGNIGVCANLYQKPFFGNLNKISLENISHRILLNAYYNAIFNYKINPSEGDLLEAIDFSKFEKISMVGFFKPIYEKLLKIGKKAFFFDFREIEGKTDFSKMPDILKSSNAVIISATTIFNGTLSDILKFSPFASKFLLGPSALFHQYFFENGIDGIFGTIFQKNDFKILEIIENNGGTKDFLKYGKKIFQKNANISKQYKKTMD